MEVQLHGAQKLGTRECLCRALERVGLHGQCLTGESCVRRKRAAVCETAVRKENLCGFIK